MDCSMPGFPVLHYLPKFAQALVVWAGDAIQPSYPLSIIPFSSCPQSFPASVFSSESALHIRWPKYCNFSFSIRPSSEYSGLISFRIDWFDILAAQESFPAQFQSVNYFILSLLYGPTLTSIQNYWKNHSFEYMDFCQQSDISAF